MKHNSNLVKKIFENFSGARAAGLIDDVVVHGRLFIEYPGATEDAIIPVAFKTEDEFWAEEDKNKLREGCIYLTLNQGGAKKADIDRLFFLSIDVDKITSETEARKRIDEVIKRCEKLEIKPFVVIRTMNGFHVHWLLAGERASECSANGEFEAVQRRLAEMFGADTKAIGRERIWRVDGTIYHKYGWRYPSDEKVPLVAARLNQDVEPLTLAEIARRIGFDIERLKNKERYLMNSRNNSRRSVVSNATPAAADVSSEFVFNPHAIELLREKASQLAVSVGERHGTMLEYAITLRFYGANEEDLDVCLREFNERACEAPLPDGEVEGIIRWCLEKPKEDVFPNPDFLKLVNVTRKDLGEKVEDEEICELTNEELDLPFRLMNSNGQTLDSYSTDAIRDVLKSRLPNLVRCGSTVYHKQDRVLMPMRVEDVDIRGILSCAWKNVVDDVIRYYGKLKNDRAVRAMKTNKNTITESMSLSRALSYIPQVSERQINHRGVLLADGAIWGKYVPEDAFFLEKMSKSTKDITQEDIKRAQEFITNVAGPPDSPAHKLLKRLIIQCGFTYNDSRFIFFFVGPANSGKTSILRMLGSIYGRRIKKGQSYVLTSDNINDISTFLAETRGCSAVTLDEAPRLFRSPLLQYLISGERGQSIRLPHSASHIELEAMKLTTIITINTLPKFKDLDSGILDKAVVIRFQEPLSESVRLGEKELERLFTELPLAFLLYCEEEYNLFMEGGEQALWLDMKPVIQESRKFLVEYNEFGYFVLKHYEHRKGSVTSADDLTSAWREYVIRHNIKDVKVSPHYVGRQMSAMFTTTFPRSQNSNGCIIYRNLARKTTF